ncbi:MAG: lysophospholipid acyltransferase family protein [Phascolarctobacterium sp.]|nr:lysophospholipid acyltransferase family protein [Phascolarctobacterium sp.]
MAANDLRINSTIYNVSKNILKFFFKIFLRIEYHGKENVPLNGPLVLASNHISNLDPPCVGAGIDRIVRYMAKKELFVPILGTIWRAWGGFPVKRGGADRSAIKMGIDILQDGQCLAIFPEGTRSKTGKLGKAQPGALMMASKAKAPIVPACIIGSDVFRQGKLWPKVIVKYGKPIYFPEGEPVTKELLNSMTEQMMQEIAKLQAGEA